MFEHIVVGVDGREGGRGAVALARRLVPVGGKLTLAYVVAGDAHAYRGTGGAPEVSDGGHAEALLEAVRGETGVEAHLRWYRSSSVGRGLHDLCGVIAADLLVVGSSRRGLLGRVLIGDDTSAALNGAPCAIAIAPSDYSQQPGMTREIGVGYDGSAESEHAVSAGGMRTGECAANLSAPEVFQLPSYAFVGPGTADNAPQCLVEDALERIAGLGDVEPHAAYG